MKYGKFSCANFMMLILVAALSACNTSRNSATNSQPQPVQPAPAASPIVVSSPAISSNVDQSGKKSATPDNVPEIMRRPMTKEEMEKAMQALPPEVRARLQGLGKKPVGPSGSPTPKK